MGRLLLAAEIIINNIKICIGTVHLESLNNSLLRKKQL